MTATPITITIPHKLGAAEARQRIDEGFEKLQRQFGGNLAEVEKRWKGDRLSFRAKAVGQVVSGWLDVGESQVKMEVFLPGLLGMLAGKIRGGLEKQGQLLLEKK